MNGSPTDATSNGKQEAEAAYDSLRAAILQRDLGPGMAITETQLAARFGLSRAAVRAALPRLHHERLITPQAHRGYAVAPVTVQQVNDLFGLRLVLEPAATRLAAGRITAGELANLESLNEQCQRDVGHEDMDGMRRANLQFHVAIAAASGNERLGALVRTVLEELGRVMYQPELEANWGLIDSTVEEHERIITALRAHDGAAAEAAALAHVTPHRQDAIEALIRAPQLRSLNLVGPA